MPKGLVIVESPGKVKAIQKYLGKGFTVEASFGHVKDLPKSTLGVDVDNEFETEYVVIPGKEKIVAKLKKLALSMDTIYLASDPDREGEAIAAHLAEELGDGAKKKKKKKKSQGRGRWCRRTHPPGHLQRDHQAGGAGGLRASPQHRSQPGGCATGSPGSRSSGRLSGLPSALGQGSPRFVSRPGADRCSPPDRRAGTRGQGLPEAGVLDHRRPSRRRPNHRRSMPVSWAEATRRSK